MDNRERARVRDKKQRRPILSKEKHENFLAAVRKLEMLANTKVKMSSRETSEQEHKKLFLGKTCNKEVSGSFAL